MSSNLGDPKLALSNFQKALSIQQELMINSPNDIKLTLKLAASHMFAGALYGASLRNLKMAHEQTEQCLTLVSPLVHAGNHKIVKRLIACSTMAAHWRTLDEQTSLAAQHLRDAIIFV